MLNRMSNAFHQVGRGAVNLVASSANTAFKASSSALGNLAVIGVKVAMRVELKPEKRTYLRAKCQPFTNEALPKLVSSLAPIVADKLKEFGQWIPSQNNTAQEFLKQVPEDLILVLTSRILNFLDPGQQISEDLFDISVNNPNAERRHTKFEDYKANISQFLENDLSERQIDSLLTELTGITIKWDEQKRIDQLEEFAKKISSLRVKPQPHPLAELMDELFTILRKDEQALLAPRCTVFLEKLHFFASSALQVGTESEQETGVAEEELNEINFSELSFEEQKAAHALVKEFNFLLFFEEENREQRIAQFSAQLAKNFELSCFAAKLTTILIGENGSALPFGGVAGFFTKKIFDELHFVLSKKVLWAFGREWLSMPKPTEVEPRHAELVVIASQVAQQYVRAELERLSQPSTYEQYKKKCDKLADSLYELAWTHLPGGREEEVACTIQTSLQAILDWVRESPGTRQWAQSKIPEILGFFQPYLAPILQRIEENFTNYYKKDPTCLKLFCHNLEQLVKRPRLKTSEELCQSDPGYCVAKAAEQKHLLALEVKERTDAAASLLAELSDIAFTGALGIEPVNLPLPPGLRALTYTEVKGLACQADSPFRSAVSTFLQDYVLAPATDARVSQHLIQSFKTARQAALFFIEEQLTILESSREKRDECFQTALTKIIEIAEPHLPIEYKKSFEKTAGDALTTVFDWLLNQPAQSMRIFADYLPLVIDASEDILAPVLQQIEDNIRDCFKADRAMIIDHLAVARELLRRPTHDEVVGVDSKDTGIKRLQFAHQKADLAVAVLREWVEISFKTSHSSPVLNWPLAKGLREALYATALSQFGPSAANASGDLAPIKKIILPFVLCYCPLDYAPQQEEISDEYRQALNQAVSLGVLGARKWLREHLYALWLHPQTYEQCRDNLVECVVRLAAPRLPVGYEEEFRTFIEGLVAPFLNSIRDCNQKELGSVINYAEDCLLVVADMLEDFLPPILKQIAQNVEQYQPWHEFSERQLNFLSRAMPESELEHLDQTVEGSLLQLKRIAQIVLGEADKKSNLPLPDGLTGLIQRGIKAQLDPRAAEGSLLRDKLRELMQTYLLSTQVESRFAKWHEFAFSRLSFETERALSGLCQEERRESAVRHIEALLAPLLPKMSDELSQKIIRPQVGKFFDWLATNDSSLREVINTQLPTLIGFAQSYLKPVLPRIEDNLRAFLADRPKFVQTIKDLADIVGPVDQPSIHEEAQRFAIEQQLAFKTCADHKAAAAFKVLTALVDAALGIEWPNGARKAFTSNLPLAPGMVESIRSGALSAMTDPVQRAFFVSHIVSYLVPGTDMRARKAEKEQQLEEVLGEAGARLSENIADFFIDLALHKPEITDKLCQLGGAKLTEVAQVVGQERYSLASEQFTLEALDIHPEQIIKMVAEAVGEGRGYLLTALKPTIHQTIVTVLGNTLSFVSDHTTQIRDDEAVLGTVHKLVERIHHHIEFVWDQAQGAHRAYPYAHPVIAQDSKEARLAHYQELSSRLANRICGKYCADLPLGKKGQQELYELLMEMLPEVIDEQITLLASGELQFFGLAALLHHQNPAGLNFKAGGMRFGNTATGQLLVQTGLRMVLPGHGTASRAAKMLRLDKWLGNYILKQVGSLLEQDASLQSQVLKLAQLGAEYLPAIEKAILAIDASGKVDESASTGPSLAQAKSELHQKFYELYRYGVTKGIDMATNGLARSVRRAYLRAQASSIVWTNSLMVCEDCYWIGKQARQMTGLVVCPALFGVLNAIVEELEAIMQLVELVTSAIYRAMSNCLWGKNWEQKQADLLIRVLEDKSYMHLLFHILDDMVDIVSQDGAERLQEAAIVASAQEQPLRFEKLWEHAAELPQEPHAFQAESGS